MTTLAARVLEAIEAAEQLVKVPNQFGWPQEGSWHTLHCGANWGNQNCDCECPVPVAILRRCAADRKILAFHGPTGAYVLNCKACSCAGALGGTDCIVVEPYPCDTLIALAEGYGVPLEQEET